MTRKLIYADDAKEAIEKRIISVGLAEEACMLNGLHLHQADMRSSAAGLRMALDELDSLPAAEGKAKRIEVPEHLRLSDEQKAACRGRREHG